MKSDFLGENEENLVGVVVYGQCAGRSAARSICNQIKLTEVLELTRLWIEDLPQCKNIESYCISQSIKLIKRDFPQIKCILSYADASAGHLGGIYKACNFIFQGCGEIALMSNYSISLSGPPNEYKWEHSRTVSSRYGSHNVEHLKKSIRRTFYRKKESNKYRYVLFISNKSENKKFIKNLKHPSLPYVKNLNHVEEIEKIEVKENNDFFE